MSFDAGKRQVAGLQGRNHRVELVRVGKVTFSQFAREVFAPGYQQQAL
jgi:hypothetical protein